MSAMLVRLDESGERYSGPDENQTLAFLRAGNEAAFLDLVDRCTPAMQKIARASVRDDATAEDVVQEAWLGVLRGLQTFEGSGSLRAWIFTIVVNRAKTSGVTKPNATIRRCKPTGLRDRANRGRGIGGTNPSRGAIAPKKGCWVANSVRASMPPSMRCRRHNGRLSSCAISPGSQPRTSVTHWTSARPMCVCCSTARAKLRRALDPYLTGEVLA
jgi:hypothetical protein